MSAGPTAALVRATLRRRSDLLVLNGWALVGALPTFLSGQAIARALDDGFLAGRPAIGMAWLAGLAGSVPVGALGARMTYRGVARVVEPLRDDLVRQVVSQTLRGSTISSPRRESGAVARLTQHVETVRETVAGLLLLVLNFVAAVVAAMAGMLALAPAVLPLVIGPLLVSLAVFAASLRRLTCHQERQLLAEEALADRATESLSGLRDIVACGGEEAVLAQLDEPISDQEAAGRALAGASAARGIIVSVGSRLPVILVLASAGWLLERGLSAGALLGTITYLLQGLEPALASLVSGLGVAVAQLTVTVRRLDEAESVPDMSKLHAPGADMGPDSRSLGTSGADSAAGAAIRLHGVTFRYRETAEPVLNALNLEIPAGDHLAVVGPSGSGKSTLAGLVVGVLRAQAGTIHYGSRPVDELQPVERVLIPQEAYVFSGSLKENLHYLRPEVSAQSLDLAVQRLGLAELVARLGGYEADLEPSLLSAGERQLIALTRAYVSEARLMVLDEATCHLDPVAEATVEQAFIERGGTLIVVAHRISSARRARRILVIDGPATFLGDHDTLLERSTLYRDLVGHWLTPSLGSST